MAETVFNRVLEGLNNYKNPCSILLATGESILEIDKVVKLIDWSNRTGNPIRLLTTGVPLISKNIKLLESAKYLSVQVTFDGFHSSDIEGVQQINLQKVKEKIVSAANRLNILFNYTLTNKNHTSLLELIDFAFINNITEVYVTPMMEYELCEDAYKFIPNLDDESIIRSITLAKERALFHGIKFIIGLGKSPYLENLNMLQKRCQKIGMFRPIVRVDGKVSICWGREDVLLGDLHNDHLDRLLYSELLLSLRANHAAGNLSRFCEDCIVYKNSRLNVMKIPNREPTIPVNLAM